MQKSVPTPSIEITTNLTPKRHADAPKLIVHRNHTTPQPCQDPQAGQTEPKPFSSFPFNIYSCIHTLEVLFIFFIIIRCLDNLFLLHQILPIERTRPIQPQPRPHTIQIEAVRLMAWQLHHKTILVIQKRIPANRTDIGLPQLLPRHPLQTIQIALWYASHLLWGRVDVRLDVFDEDVEEGGIFLVRSVLAESVVLVLEEAVGGCDVDGGGRCVGIVVGVGWCRVGFDLREVVEERAH